MQVKMYKAFLIQPEGKKYQVIKPAIFMSISQMIDIIEKGQPYREMINTDQFIPKCSISIQKFLVFFVIRTRMEGFDINEKIGEVLQ